MSNNVTDINVKNIENDDFFKMYIPSELYYVTTKENVENIKTNGFMPNDNMYIEFTDAIYTYYHMHVIRQNRHLFTKDSTTIFEIANIKIQPPTDIRFHFRDEIKDKMVYYTYDFIDSKYIKEITYSKYKIINTNGLLNIIHI